MCMLARTCMYVSVHVCECVHVCDVCMLACVHTYLRMCMSIQVRAYVRVSRNV